MKEVIACGSKLTWRILSNDTTCRYNIYAEAKALTTVLIIIVKWKIGNSTWHHYHLWVLNLLTKSSKVLKPKLKGHINRNNDLIRLARDNWGRWIEGFCQALQAELWGVRRAMTRVWLEAIVETDSLIAVNLINKEKVINHPDKTLCKKLKEAMLLDLVHVHVQAWKGPRWISYEGFNANQWTCAIAQGRYARSGLPKRGLVFCCFLSIVTKKEKGKKIS